MNPNQKKLPMKYIIAAIVGPILLYLSLMIANALWVAEQEPIIKYGTERLNIDLFMETLNNMQLIHWKPNPFWGGAFLVEALFLLVTLTWEEKKFITGREHGDAEWEQLKSFHHLKAKIQVKIAYKREIDLIEKRKQTLKRIIRKDQKELKKLYKKKKKDNGKLPLEYVSLEKLLKDRIKEHKRELAKNLKNKKLSAAEKKEILDKLKDKYSTSESIVTKELQFCRYNWEINDHTLVVAGSGRGKTRGYVLPNILEAALSKDSPSFVITDPKGEIIYKIGWFLKKVCGYKIRVLDLMKMSRADCYNPFHYIHKEREGWEERVLNLIETLLMNTDSDEAKSNAGDPFWPKAEKLFLQAIFFATIQAFPEEEQNMNTAITLIRWLKIEEEKDKKNSKLDRFFEKFKEKFGEDNIAYDQYQEFRGKASGKTAKSIVISAVARLAPFKIKEVRRIFSRDDMLLDRVGEEQICIVVCMEPTNVTFKFIPGMLYLQLNQEINYCANALHGGSLPVKVRYIMDEYANTCRVPRFVEFLAYARSLGVSISIIIQSVDQLKDIHDKQSGVIIDCCSTFLFMGGIKEPESLEFISKMIGKGTFDKRSYSKTKGSQYSYSVSEDKIGQELMTTDQLQKLPKDHCIVFVSGYSAFYGTIYPYMEHRNYSFTSDFDKKYVYEHIPVIKEEDQQKEEPEEVKDESPKRSLIKIDKSNERHEKALQIIQENKLIFGILDEGTSLEDTQNTEDVSVFMLQEEVEEMLIVDDVIKRKKQKEKDSIIRPPISTNPTSEGLIEAVQEIMEDGNIGILETANMVVYEEDEGEWEDDDEIVLDLPDENMKEFQNQLSQIEGVDIKNDEEQGEDENEEIM